MASNNREKYYVYNLPWVVRKDLCRILNQNDKWEYLAAKLEYDTLTILELRRNKSPTDSLLELWDQKNPTVQELFLLLAEMEHYRAMLILKDYVPEEMHKLIPPSSTSVASRVNARVTSDKMAGIEENLNVSKTSNLTPSKLNFPMAESKIVNVVKQPSLDNSIPETGSHRRLSNGCSITSAAESCSTIPRIDYSELAKATNGWHESNILGRGGFGTVFKGIWKNTQVAIKRMEQALQHVYLRKLVCNGSYVHVNGKEVAYTNQKLLAMLKKGNEMQGCNQVLLQQSLTELNILNSRRHDNILPLYGFSVGGSEPCLVYQFMPNGSLEDRLLCRDGTPPLTWTQRHAIAEGAARGLQFLHNSTKPFIHGDIKSANILLDLNFVPRIGDFGLAREGPQSQYTHLTVSRVHGTRPYLPEEFMRNKQISVKVDTYSFGIVLFEIATGLRAYDRKRTKRYLKEHVESCPKEEWLTLMDRKPPFEDAKTFELLLLLGTSCVHKQPRYRPDMENVLKSLETKTIIQDNVGSSNIATPSQHNVFVTTPKNSAACGGLTLAIPSPYSPCLLSPSNQQGLSINSQPPFPPVNLANCQNSQSSPFHSPSSHVANLQVISANSQLPASRNSAHSPTNGNHLPSQFLPACIPSPPIVNQQVCSNSLLPQLQLNNSTSPHSPVSISPSSQNAKQEFSNSNQVPLLCAYSPSAPPVSLHDRSSPRIAVVPPSQEMENLNFESSADNVTSSQNKEDLPLLSILGIKDDTANYTPSVSDVAST